MWSPDGRWIVVSANNDNDAVFNYDLYRYAPDGSGRKRITDTPKRYEGSPDFSADGKRLSCTVYVEGTGSTDVMTMKLDGTDVRNVTKNVRRRRHAGDLAPERPHRVRRSAHGRGHRDLDDLARRIGSRSADLQRSG